MITTVIISNPYLSSKYGSMSYLRQVELQSPLPGNGAILLSLQETPLGCSLRIPGNLNCFLGFSDMDQDI